MRKKDAQKNNFAIMKIDWETDQKDLRQNQKKKRNSLRKVSNRCQAGHGVAINSCDRIEADVSKDTLSGRLFQNMNVSSLLVNVLDSVDIQYDCNTHENQNRHNINLTELADL